MKNKIYIFTFLFFISCSSPVKITYINEGIYPEETNQRYALELTIYQPRDSIKYEYVVVGEIEVNNNAVWGNLIFDKKIKRYLLNTTNQIEADALIYNEEKSNQSFSYFNAIRYHPSDSINIISYD